MTDTILGTGKNSTTHRPSQRCQNAHLPVLRGRKCTITQIYFISAQVRERKIKPAKSAKKGRVQGWMLPGGRTFQAEGTASTKAAQQEAGGAGAERCEGRRGRDGKRRDGEGMWVTSCRDPKAMVGILVFSEKPLKGFEQE